jgi:hypothetical protein
VVQDAFVAAVREPKLRDPGRKMAKGDADQVLTDLAQAASSAMKWAG